MYEPTIYFPEKIFSGTFNNAGYPCGGTYTQSIVLDTAVAGVVITDQP